jgi:hypothetical protein
MKYTKEDKEQAEKTLRALLRPGMTVYTLLERVSRSGMQRSVKLYVVNGEELRHLSWSVACFLGMSRKQREEGITIDGCGMDMGFDLVYRLGRALYSTGYLCTGDQCTSSDHYGEKRMDRFKGLHAKDFMHTHGGYALNQRWI